MADLIAPSDFPEKMAEIPVWALREKEIQRQYQFSGFPEAMAFVNRVAEAAEAENHHPDIDIRWNRVTLTLSTHSKGGLTELDFFLARECDKLAGNP